MNVPPIVWNGDHRSGYFEVDGVKTEVPDFAELPEILERMSGRRIVSIGEFGDDSYWLRLDDGQVVEFCGIWRNDSTAETGVRFWNGDCGVSTEQSPPEEGGRVV